MNKIITSLIAISFAMPAMAEITNNATCDTTNLGQSENNSTANVEATWTPNIYRVSYECLNGNALNFLLEANECYTSNPTSDCVNPGVAVYGEGFNFAGALACEEPGYTFTNWSCTDSNNNTTTYTANEHIGSWNIASNLTCVEQRTANTINIDWNPKNGAAHTTNTCTYGETITLPTEPTKTGYTFGGWILKPCSSYTTEQTCPTEQCQWKAGSGDTGTCMTPESYCSSFDDENTCPSGCAWDDENNECYLNTNQQNTSGNLSLLG